jgi:hypothetical protein
LSANVTIENGGAPDSKKKKVDAFLFTVPVEQVMWSIHTSPANGGAHRAAHSLLQVFNSRFFTPEAKGHAERIVHDCPVCQQTRARAPDGLLGTDDRAKRRFGIIHIDVTTDMVASTPASTVNTPLFVGAVVGSLLFLA